MNKENIVVVAIDGSDASKVAVRWAANTAMKRDIPLRLAASYHAAVSLRRRNGSTPGTVR